MTAIALPTMNPPNISEYTDRRRLDEYVRGSERFSEEYRDASTSVEEYQKKILDIISSKCENWCKTRRIGFSARCISSRCHNFSSFLTNFKRIVTREKNLMLRDAVIEDRFNPGNNIIEEMCKTRTRKTFLNERGITNQSTARLLIQVYDKVCKDKRCSLTNCFAKLINLERLTDDIVFVKNYIEVVNSNVKYKKLQDLLFFKRSTWIGGKKKTRCLRKFR
jgi:hypothetical protein